MGWHCARAPRTTYWRAFRTHLSREIRLTQSPLSGRSLLVDLYEAAVAGAAPEPVTTAALQDFSARPGQRLWLYAVGKAAHPMASAATASLQRSLHRIAGGVIVAPELAPSPYTTVVALQGDHPLPRRHSFTAAERIGDSAVGMRGDDIAIVLLSGGATSLIAAPLRGMSESDLGQLFELLLGSGLDIHQMNAIRKRFTRWGAGRLALALAPARTFVYLMSDVVGDDPADIGSGPCTPDTFTVKQVTELLQQCGILQKLSPAMRDYLTSVARGMTPETPRRTHPAFAHVTTRIIGSNRLALEAVRAHAIGMALDVECIATPLKGDAAMCGALVADKLLELARTGKKGCIVWGGETTVTLGGSHDGVLGSPGGPPSGGRCQELALAASRRLAEGGEAASHVSLVAAGTDGRDGTSSAAGAFADATVWAAIRESGRDPALALQRHEAFSALGAAGALLPERRTGTNVMDVVIGIVE